MKTYWLCSETTTVHMCEHPRGGFQVYTWYKDAESEFASYVKRFNSFMEAEGYALKLVTKFAH